jgi:hypothetical protein
MKLRDVAFSRAGDKCDVSNVCVFPYDEADFEVLREKLTIDTVRAKFGDLVKGEIVRYEYPNLKGFNFVMRGALGGGGTFSLRADRIGKSLASLMLDIDV